MPEADVRQDRSRKWSGEFLTVGVHGRTRWLAKVLRHLGEYRHGEDDNERGKRH
jgi:hypothetical protein